MKIISKYRDYYDHLVGYYGFDETRVYDRRNDCKNLPSPLPGKYPNSTHHYLIAICGTLYPIVEHKSRLYHAAEDLPDDVLKDYKHFLSLYGFKKNHNFPSGSRPKTQINIKTRQPAVLVETSWVYDIRASDFIPNLSQFGIPSVLDAHSCYQQIYNFLGWLKDNPVPPNNQTNEEKIVSHGFDLKHSFRPKIK